MQGWAGQNNTFLVVLLDVLGSPYQGTTAVPLLVTIESAASTQVQGSTAATGAEVGVSFPLAAAQSLDTLLLCLCGVKTGFILCSEPACTLPVRVHRWGETAEGCTGGGGDTAAASLVRGGLDCQPDKPPWEPCWGGGRAVQHRRQHRWPGEASVYALF